MKLEWIRTHRAARAVGQIGFIAVVLGIGWMVWHRDDPERLGELHQGLVPLQIVNGAIYREVVDEVGSPMDNRPASHRISLRLVTGGAEKIVAREESAAGFVHLSSGATDQGSDGGSGLPGRLLLYNGPHSRLLYGLVPLPPKPRAPGKGGVGQTRSTAGTTSVPVQMRPPTSFLGTFLAPDGSGRTRPGEKRVWRKFSSPPVVTLVRAVDLAGGNPRTLVSVPELQAIAEGYAVGLRPRSQGTYATVTSKPYSWQEWPGGDEIVVSSLENDHVRAIRASAPVRDLSGAGSGIFWTTLRAYPDRARDLFYVRLPDGRPTALGTVAKSQRPQSVVECHGRLYWTVIVSSANGPTGELYTANQDGTGAHKLMPSPAAPYCPIEDMETSASVYVFRDDLYCVMGACRPRAQSDDTRAFAEAGPVATASGPPARTAAARIYLGRIRPNDSNRVEVLRGLPAGFGYQYDQGYLYFVQREVRRSLLANLTDDSAGEVMVDTLCRVPLPR